MNVIKFNNEEFEVEHYSKTTHFSQYEITSSANCSVNGDIATLNTLAESPITSIQIICNNEVIYNLQNITAHIDSISENFPGDRMYINVSMTFD